MIEAVAQSVMESILDEIKHAEEKHPGWPEDLLHQVMIASEEMGEVQHAALEMVELLQRVEASGNDGADVEEAIQLDAHIDREMAQVGAMAIRFLYHRRLRCQTMSASQDTKQPSHTP